jgi:hypothetical protein
MASRNTPQTPQTPRTPPNPPTGSETSWITVERTVINTAGHDLPQTPGSAARAVPTTTADNDSTTTSCRSVADMIKPQTLLQVQLGISTIEIDGETIIHDELRNANYRLNVSGSYIWSHISPQNTFADLLASIRATHDVIPREADRMVAEFLADLICCGVLAASNGRTLKSE